MIINISFGVETTWYLYVANKYDQNEQQKLDNLVIIVHHGIHTSVLCADVGIILEFELLV